jgi:acyl carrier protein
MIEEAQIRNDVKKFIETNITAGGFLIEPATVLADAGIDSFSIVEIILFIERKYGVSIPNEEMLPDNFKTITAVAKTVKKFL